MAELRLPLRLGAGSGGMETGPPPAEPEERGQCCCVLDSRKTHTGVAVGQLLGPLPTTHPSSPPVVCSAVSSLLRRLPCSRHRVRCGAEVHGSIQQMGGRALGTRSTSWCRGSGGPPEDADPQVRTVPPGAPPLAGCSVQVPKARPAHPWAWPSAGIRTSPVCPGGDQAGRRAGASLYPGVSFPGAAPRPSLAGRVSPHPSFLSGKSQK